MLRVLMKWYKYTFCLTALMHQPHMLRSSRLLSQTLSRSTIFPKTHRLSLHTMASKSFTLFVTLHVAPNDVEKLFEAHRPIWASVAAEPECLLFDVFQSTEDRGKVRFVEVWSKDREWFESVCSPRRRCTCAIVPVALECRTCAHWLCRSNSRSRIMRGCGRIPSRCGRRIVSCFRCSLLLERSLIFFEGQLEFFERQGEGLEVKQQYLTPGK